MGELGHLKATEANRHIPVLLDEVLDGLAVRDGGHYLDATVGGGGHSLAILDACAPHCCVLGLDRDPEAVARASLRFKDYAQRIKIIHASYVHLIEIATREKFLPVDGVLFDLGFSSWQIENPDRGFSHHWDGPLDMRYNTNSLLPTAADLVNSLPESELADLIWHYGEETQSRRIAKTIVAARPIRTSGQLAKVIVSAKTRMNSQRIHPATQTFQAIRIAVNDELAALRQALPQALQALRLGGRLVVISFHSLEDRIVKQFIKQEIKDCICPPETPVCICQHHRSLRMITRKVVTPSKGELERNPRSRSAKLRIAEKIA